MRSFIIVAATVAAIASGTALAATAIEYGSVGSGREQPPERIKVNGIAPHCERGKPCGHACIAKNKVCHAGNGDVGAPVHGGWNVQTNRH
jgi:hypothetical protein